MTKKKYVFGNILILGKFLKKRLIINYDVKGEFNKDKQQVIFEFLDNNNKSIHKSYHLKHKEYRILYVHDSSNIKRNKSIKVKVNQKYIIHMIIFLMKDYHQNMMLQN